MTTSVIDRSLLIPLTLALATAQLTAQAVRGRVVDATTGQPVERGFVVLLDTTGQERGRSLTTVEGYFLLDAVEPGRYYLRSERIGYGVWESDTLLLRAGEDIEISVAVTSLPTQLPTLVVPGDDRCGDVRAQGEFGSVWEEIRKALTAATWTEQQGYSAALHLYRRERARRGGSIRSENVWRDAGLALQPFVAWHPDSLLAHGYIVGEAEPRWYYGPDANVLLHDGFHQTHCFNVASRTRDEVDLVGLEFRPDPERRLPDIDGTVWVDRVTSELRHIEWQYVNTPFEVSHEDIGGRVSFQHLSTGDWIISSWQVSAPVVEQRWLTDDRGRAYSVPRLTGFWETGGRVIELTDMAGSVVYTSRDIALIRGQAIDSTRQTPAAAQLVSVLGTGYETRTDSGGRFELRTLLHGQYTLTFARMDSLGYLPGHVSRSFLPGDMTSVTLTVPSLRSVQRSLCPRTGIPDTTRALVGVLRDGDTGEPLSDVEVHAWWRRLDRRDTSRDTRRRDELGRSSTRTDENGNYVVCGLPPEQIIRLEVSLREPKVEPIDVVFSEDRVTIDSEQLHETYHTLDRIGKVDLIARPDSSHS